jgi:hypothetical protein
VIDTSGGNVTHAAVSLVAAMGARHVTLYGADYSYPAGKPYARGTYLYDVFGASQDRVRPLHSKIHAFIFRTDDVRADRSGEHLRYTTPLLDLYRENLVRLMSRCPAMIEAVPGAGLSLRHDHEPRTTSGDHAMHQWLPGPTACGWRELLDGYADALVALPGLADPPWRSFETLGPAMRELWATLLPIAARVAREKPPSAGTAGCLEEARAWAVSRTRRIVDATPQTGQE